MNEKKILQHTVSYDEGLLEALKDPVEARAYFIVGATLVVALLRFRWLNAPCSLGAHKGRPYT